MSAKKTPTTIKQMYVVCIEGPHAGLQKVDDTQIKGSQLSFYERGGAVMSAYHIAGPKLENIPSARWIGTYTRLDA